MKIAEVMPRRGLTARVRVWVGQGDLPAIMEAIEYDLVAIDGLDFHEPVVVPLRSETKHVDGLGWLDVIVSGWVRDEVVQPRQIAVGPFFGHVVAFRTFPQIALVHPMIISDKEIGVAADWLFRKAIEPSMIQAWGRDRSKVLLTSTRDRDRLWRRIVGDRSVGEVGIEARDDEVVVLGQAASASTILNAA